MKMFCICFDSASVGFGVGVGLVDTSSCEQPINVEANTIISNREHNFLLILQRIAMESKLL